MDELLAALRDETLANKVDAPLQRATESFRLHWRTPFDLNRFHAVLAAYHAHLVDPAAMQPPGDDQGFALAGAVDLLDASFRGTWADGYHGAIVEAVNDPSHGIHRVLASLLQAMQIEARRRAVHHIYCRRIDALDWRGRAAVADELRRRLGAASPGTLDRLPAVLLAPCIRDLVEAVLEAERRVDHLLRDPRHQLP